MIIVGCPDCGWPLVLPDRRLGLVLVCLNCEHGFNTGTARVLSRRAARGERSAGAPEAPGDLPSSLAQARLTSPHECSHCGAALPATGHRRTLLTCPDCARPTSVYAVLYHCLECNVLLESPRSWQGRTTRCPAC